MTSHNKGVLIAYLSFISMGIGITVVQAIPINSASLVFYRCLIAAPALWIIAHYRNSSLSIATEDRRVLAISGLLTGAHWVSLFISIKLGTVALAIVSFYTYPVFATLIEAAVQKRRPRTIDLGIAAITLTGVTLLTPFTGAPTALLPSVLVGILSGVFWSGRIVLIRDRLRQYDGGTVLFWNLVTIGVLLTPTLFLDRSPLEWETSTLVKVLFLSLFVTAICHTLTLVSLRHISATLLSQIGPIQTLVAALAGWFFLQEAITPRLIFGGLLISAAGVGASWVNRSSRQASKSPVVPL